MVSLFNSNKEPKSLDLLYEIRGKLLAAPWFSCDFETTGLDLEEDSVTMMALATEHEGWALNTLDYTFAQLWGVFREVFQDSNKICTYHNANFDLKWFHKEGYYPCNQVADTMLMVWLYDEDVKRYGGYNLKHCALKELNHRMATLKEARSLFGNMGTYATDDAVQTVKLYLHYKEKLEKLGMMRWFEKVEMPICQLLIETETWGVTLDKDQLRRIKREAYKTVERLEEQIYGVVGYKFNVGSSKQLAKALFKDMGIGTRADGTNEFSTKGKTNARTGQLGEWSTAVDVLKAILRSDCKVVWPPVDPPEEPKELHAAKIASLLLQHREIVTRLNTFIRPLLERCKGNKSCIIHPRFIQIGTVTGRFASKDPNYQNLPRKGGVRRAFVARPGYKIVKADFSQAELRLMAHMSRDPVMLGIYRDPDGDIHQTTADACGVSRQAAKAINFGLIYRMSGNRLKGQLAMEGIIISKGEADNYVRKYFKKYKRVREYHKLVEKHVKSRLDNQAEPFFGEFGYIRTLGGRYRKLDREYLTNHKTEYPAITQAINTTIQGGVSDLIKVAMVDTWREFRRRGWLDPENGIWDAVIQGQVHDEIFIECKEEIAEEVADIVNDCMVNAGVKFKISVPMLADAEIVDSLAKAA